MEQKKKSIGNRTYLVTEMDGIRALKTQTKLLKILGPGAIGLIGKDISDIGMKQIATMVGSLMNNFDDETINDFVLSLFEEQVFIEKKGQPFPIDFAIDFTGKISEAWKVVAFILEVNFAGGKPTGSSSHTTEPEPSSETKEI